MSAPTRPRQNGARSHVRRAAGPLLAALPPAVRRTTLHAFGRYAPWEEGFDFTPPTPRPDEVTGPPEFVGIGVQKAGTTWWYDLICAHPAVAVRDEVHKERHFFDRFGNRPFGPADAAAYQGWFPRRRGLQSGEWTPDYIALPWVAPLLSEAAPLVRLLVLVRDPVERFRSGLSHHRRYRGRVTSEVCADAVGRGFYDQQLARWAATFPSDRVLVLQYERCVADPLGQLARTYDFLGLDPFVPEGVPRGVSVTAEPAPLDEEVRQRLVALYAGDVRALAGRVPEIDLGLWPNFATTGARRSS